MTMNRLHVAIWLVQRGMVYFTPELYSCRFKDSDTEPTNDNAYGNSLHILII